MSDSRVSQRPEEDAVPADAASSPDVSTDVAPTRKARRRPEVQTMAPEKEEGSKVVTRLKLVVCLNPCPESLYQRK